MPRESSTNRNQRDLDREANNDNNASERKRFIRNVYLILTCQLMFTFGFIALCGFVDQIYEQISLVYAECMYAYWITTILVLVTCTVLLNFEKINRKKPYNFICLVVFTILLSILWTVLAPLYERETHEILLTLLVTMGICIACTLFAMQVKLDFTAYSDATIVLLILLGILIIIAFFFPSTVILYICICAAAFMLSFILIIDTQLICGKYRFTFTSDAYVFGAFLLYINIAIILSVASFFVDTFISKKIF